jgi:predicted DNA binding protein
LGKKFDLDLMWTHPMKVSKEKVILSFIGEEPSIRKMVELVGFFGEVAKMTVQEASFSATDLLRSLTDRQRELLIAARRLGYYSYPRTADADDVARFTGLSRSTVVEHLRKAEIRLVDRILSGQ